MSLSMNRLAAVLSTAACLVPAPALVAQNGKDPFNGTSELRQGVSATLEHWHYDTLRARWNEPRFGTTMVTFGLGGDARVRSLDVEGLGAFQRAPERPR